MFSLCWCEIPLGFPVSFYLLVHLDKLSRDLKECVNMLGHGAPQIGFQSIQGFISSLAAIITRRDCRASKALIKAKRLLNNKSVIYLTYSYSKTGYSKGINVYEGTG